MSSSARPLIVLAGSEYPGGTSRGAAAHAPGTGQTARERGLEVLVLDQARGDVGLPVVKVIIPGLRHFWRPRVRGRPKTTWDESPSARMMNNQPARLRRG